MGYRSQVRSLIFGEPDLLGGFIVQQRLIDNNPVFQEGNFKDNLSLYPIEITVYEGDPIAPVKKTIHVLDLYGESWKWYEGYAEVQAWTSFMEAAEEFGLDTEFLRIGEETDDIEHTSSSDNDWLLSVSRTINDEMNPGDNLPLDI